MAKGSAMGLWRGKKGSSVFYQIVNSNSLQKQGIRERNYEPRNPQSFNQAGQRMRMYPAQAVYGAIKDVIERSWQGVKYGQMSRQAYLARALKQPIIPAVEKGMGVVVPAPYQIAKGSLQEVSAIVSNGRALFSFVITRSFSLDDLASDFYSHLLDHNPFLKDGDQVSLVLCRSDVNGEGFFWDVLSFYIDLSSQSELGAIFGTIAEGLRPVFNESGILFSSDSYIYMAAACIISRDGDTPLRSNATLACDYSAGDMIKYYTSEAYEAARKSYMKPEDTRVTDWPADPEGEGSGGAAPTAYTYTAAAVSIGGDGSVLPDGSTGGSVTGSGSYEVGSLVALSAIPNNGYKCDGWYATQEDAAAGRNAIVSGQADGMGVTYTFVAGSRASSTLYARFEPRE